MTLGAQKESFKAEELRKLADKDQRKAKDLANKAFKDALMAGAANNFAEIQMEEKEAAERQQEKSEGALSPASVLHRLRAKSIAIILGNFMQAPDLSKHKPVKEAMYVGQKDRDGLKHGYGVIQFPEGAEYQGEWHGDLPDGHGERVCVCVSIHIDTATSLAATARLQHV